MPRNSTQQSSSSRLSARNEFNYSDMSFIVYEATSSGRQNTATFASKSQAFDFVDRFCEESSTVYIYKTKCIKAFSPSSSISDTSSQNLSISDYIEKEVASVKNVLQNPEKNGRFEGGGIDREIFWSSV